MRDAVQYACKTQVVKAEYVCRAKQTEKGVIIWVRCALPNNNQGIIYGKLRKISDEKIMQFGKKICAKMMQICQEHGRKQESDIYIKDMNITERVLISNYKNENVLSAQKDLCNKGLYRKLPLGEQGQHL